MITSSCARFHLLNVGNSMEVLDIQSSDNINLEYPHALPFFLIVIIRNMNSNLVLDERVDMVMGMLWICRAWMMDEGCIGRGCTMA